VKRWRGRGGANFVGRVARTPKTVDGIRFDSTWELARYVELKARQERGEIALLKVHPRFPFVVNGVGVATYVADFRYVVVGKNVPDVVVEDCKSPWTRDAVYRIKKKLVAALYSIDVVEITNPKWEADAAARHEKKLAAKRAQRMVERARKTTTPRDRWTPRASSRRKTTRSTKS
jgi:Protein of unknown function (DUF1064)